MSDPSSMFNRIEHGCSMCSIPRNIRIFAFLPVSLRFWDTPIRTFERGSLKSCFQDMYTSQVKKVRFMCFPSFKI